MECYRVDTSRGEPRVALKLPSRPVDAVLTVLRANGRYRKACGGGACWYLRDPRAAATQLRHIGAAEVAAALDNATRSQPSALVVRKVQ